MSSSDTIAAFSTPPGHGGIAILRISGPAALRMLGRLFSSARLNFAPLVPACNGGQSASAPAHSVENNAGGVGMPVPAAPTLAGGTGMPVPAAQALAGGAGMPVPAAQTLAGGGPAFQPRHMYLGHALDEAGDVLDEALAVYMPGPHSATGEDVGEIHCHGGPGVTTALLEAALAAGARLAEPGEFTRRAFLHGRLDLTQAEAVAELIDAPTREGVRLAAAKLDGALGREVRALRTALDGLRERVILAVDFPEEEDADAFSRDDFAATVHAGLEALERLLGGFERARLWREGATAVLAGRVNAGKSSLLNALLGRERAIVSEQPGTTRDYLEETICLAGMPVRLIDTAGLRRGGDVVEAEGIRRAHSLADAADVLLFVVDVSSEICPEETEFLRRYRELAAAGRLLLVLNKIDRLDEMGISALPAVSRPPERMLFASPAGDEILPPERVPFAPPTGDESHPPEQAPFAPPTGDESHPPERMPFVSPAPAVSEALPSGNPGREGAFVPRGRRQPFDAAGREARLRGQRYLEAAAFGFAEEGRGDPAVYTAVPRLAVSARTGYGLEDLADALRRALTRLGGNAGTGDIAPNLRQSRLLREARAELVQLEAGVRDGLPVDILGLHLDAAAALLASVTGSASTEELLDSIFASFCIGK